MGTALGGIGVLFVFVDRDHGKDDLYFEIVGKIEKVDLITAGGKICDIMRLRKQYGFARWRKLKGIATVKLHTGDFRTAEVHWYEVHGIGRKKMKIKRFLDN